MHGATCRCAADARFRARSDRVLAAVTERTKLIIICTPNNPTGNLFAQEAIESICAEARLPGRDR